MLNQTRKTEKKIIIPLKTKLASCKYGVIYIPKEYRKLFPGYKKDFSIHTDLGITTSWFTSKSDNSPTGSYIIGGLRPWFRQHKFTLEDYIVIEILKYHKEYRLYAYNKEENIDNDTDDIITGTEGGKMVVISIQAERNKKLRYEAIKFHGLICKACGFNFQKTYGDWGKNFIEVHHFRPLKESLNTKVKTDPKKDLTVLCSNCHRMIHRNRETTLTIDELKLKIKEAKINK